MPSDQKEPQEHAPGVIAPPPLIYAVGVALGWGLEQLVPLALSPEVLAPATRHIVGGLLVLLALGVVIGAVIFFHRLKTSISPYGRASSLIVGGVYRYSRNPIYLAFAVAQIGIAIGANLPWVLLMLVPVVSVMRFGVIEREERHLERVFGQEYRDYCAKVRRWI